MLVLAPHQTMAIDIRKLKDSKVPDEYGHVIPAAVTHGQLWWGQRAVTTIIGRNEEVNVTQGIARSFSCGIMCCGPTSAEFQLAPGSATMPVNGDAWPLVSQERDWTCNGPGSYYWTAWYDVYGSWSSSASSVATIVGGDSYWGENPEITTGPNGGTATITGTFDWDYNWEYMDGGTQNFCLSDPRTGRASAIVLAYTPIQHNYPRNPLPQICRIVSWFDAVRNQKPHKAQDVVYDDGNGGPVKPPYGTPVSAMEAGTVVGKASGNGPASQPYPQCAGTGAMGNYVKIRSDSDGYSTIYYHMTPSVSMNQHVDAGQQIGVLDNSGCQSGAHLHVGRKDPSNVPVNFTLPCQHPTPTINFDDGTVGDDVPDDI